MHWWENALVGGFAAIWAIFFREPTKKMWQKFRAKRAVPSK